MATVNDKEAWLKERRTGLGGSDIAKICGLSKWGSAVDVWLDKKGLAKPQAETLRMRLGTYLEPFVTELFIEATGKRCIEYTPTIHGDGERACCLANLDRIVVEPNQDIDEMVSRLSSGDLTCVESILECKTCAMLKDWYDDNGNFTVPEYYRTQIYWYLGMVPSAKRIYVATLCTGVDCEFDFICVERSDKAVDGLIAYGVNWWKTNMESADERAVMERLVAEAPSVKEVVAIYPKSNPETELVITDDIRKNLEALNRVQDEIDTFEHEVGEDGLTREDRLESLKAAITKAMRDKEFLVDNDDKHTVLATFKSGNDTIKDIVDWEAVAKALANKLGDDGNVALDSLVRENTQFGVVTRKGARPFRVKTPKMAKRSKKTAA